MTPRSSIVEFRKLSPATIEGLRSVSDATRQSGLDFRLLELVKLRASQINGCAFCLAMHVAEARKLGVEDGVMHLLAAWRDASVFSEQERAALGWAESLTLLSQGAVADDVYEEAARHFSDRELADLTGAVVAINGFNRIAVAYRFAHPLG